MTDESVGELRGRQPGLLSEDTSGTAQAMARWLTAHLADVVDSIRRWGPDFTADQRGLLDFLEAAEASRSADP